MAKTDDVLEMEKLVQERKHWILLATDERCSQVLMVLQSVLWNRVRSGEMFAVEVDFANQAMQRHLNIRWLSLDKQRISRDRLVRLLTACDIDPCVANTLDDEHDLIYLGGLPEDTPLLMTFVDSLYKETGWTVEPQQN